MPVYDAPGVYVEEVPPLARPIAGVGTSTAGFVGALDGILASKLEKAVQITSFQEYQTAFGPEPPPADADSPAGRAAIARHIYKTANRRLSLAVFGFFNNGGRVCWVVPVADLTAANLDKGLAALEPIDEIAIVAIPGETANHSKQYVHCSNLDDRTAVLDGVDGDPTVASIVPGGLPVGKDSTFAGLYYPWIRVTNPLFGDATAPEKGEEFVIQPPSGHVAGMWARSDSTRGVHKAPANEPLYGVVDVTRRLTKAQHGVLNPEGINVIRRFGGSNIVYGARTLGAKANTDFLHISTRRYMNYLKESIDEGTQFVVFEPNNPALWQRVIRSVSDFLYNEWSAGALFGETPKQAFFVKCDAETNPPASRDLGRLITEIGVAIVKPAEFVIFRIQQTSGV